MVYKQSKKKKKKKTQKYKVKGLTLQTIQQERNSYLWYVRDALDRYTYV